MLLLLMWVIILGIVAYGIQYIPMPQPFKIAAWCIMMVILVVMVFRALGVAPGGFP
jgi:hypothetical protein